MLWACEIAAVVLEGTQHLLISHNALVSEVEVHNIMVDCCLEQYMTAALFRVRTYPEDDFSLRTARACGRGGEGEGSTCRVRACGCCRRVRACGRGGEREREKGKERHVECVRVGAVVRECVCVRLSCSGMGVRGERPVLCSRAELLRVQGVGR